MTPRIVDISNFACLNKDLAYTKINLILNAGHDKSALSADTVRNVNQLIALRLAQIVRHLDPTRPVTAGCNEPSP